MAEQSLSERRTRNGFINQFTDKARHGLPLRECANQDAPVPILDTGMSGLKLACKANPVHQAVALGEESESALLNSTGEVTGEVAKFQRFPS